MGPRWSDRWLHRRFSIKYGRRRGGGIIKFEDNEKRKDFIYSHLDGTPDRFIKSIINKHYETLRYCEGVGYADLIQEGWVGLMEAAERYEEEQKVKYSTYAYYWVQKYILQTLGKDIKAHQAEGRYNQEIFADSVERVAQVSKEFEELDSKEQKILELYADGHTHREIADKIDLTHQRITQILQEIEKPNLPKCS